MYYDPSEDIIESIEQEAEEFDYSVAHSMVNHYIISTQYLVSLDPEAANQLFRANAMFSRQEMEPEEYNQCLQQTTESLHQAYQALTGETYKH